MHMADALLSPVVGGAMTAVSVAIIGYSAKKITTDSFHEKKIPLMGVMGAFIFAAQMVNFTIPATGSSGHIGGGVLLAALLGPFPALLTLSSVLLIQMLFFADGGLLAFGCNVFNLGFFTCIIAYPYIFKPIASQSMTKKNITIASIVSVIIGLQLGSFFVVLQTLLSGVTALPFIPFLFLMQPIHLAIGIVEGVVTAAILCYVHSVRPEILENTIENKKVPLKNILTAFLILTVVTGAGISLFASSFPDGLEWSIHKTAGAAELATSSTVHQVAEKAVDTTALMPDYNFPDSAENSAAGTATAGIVGSGITLLLLFAIGILIYSVKKKQLKEKQN